MPDFDYSLVHPTPGHGAPINSDKESPSVGKPLPNALSIGDIEDGGDALLPLTTLREFSMLQFMNAITDKENWHVKVLNDEIANKWKREAIQAAREARYGKPKEAPDEPQDIPDVAAKKHQEDEGELDVVDDDNDGDWEDESRPEDVYYLAPRDESAMTTVMADYCIEELRHRARSFEQAPNGAIFVYNGDVYKSDTAVSPDVHLALQKAVEPLESVPDQFKDWHPGSDGKVLDLVHPSLFPLVYGTSRVIPIGGKMATLDDCLERIGQGDVVPVPDIAKLEETAYDGNTYQSSKINPYSNKFQWLPCEVDVSGDKAKVISYINNLHPRRHQALYHVIEDVITAAIPLWELTLAPRNDEDYKPFQRINYVDAMYDPDPPSAWDNPTVGPQKDDFGDEDEYYEAHHEWCAKNRKPILPEPEKAFDPEDHRQPELFSLFDRFGKLGRPLQVIVKLANIELTPEKPDYEGGTWHVEGKMNEHIVATAIYYYSSSNITRSSLAFRQFPNPEDTIDLGYEQNVHDFLLPVFGSANEEASVQFVGSVNTREGRLITFPNILQHQVQPFSLEDRTKPGHRKILALFLVDPHLRIPSTAVVPPQQLDWFREELEKSESEAAGLGKLPVELKDHVYGEVDFPISLAKAKELREELMEERKSFALKHAKAVEGVTFSLCEH